MKVIDHLNILRSVANYYTPRGDKAKEDLIKAAQSLLPHKAPYEQGMSVVISNLQSLEIHIPYKLPEGWLYFHARVHCVGLLGHYYEFKIVMTWADIEHYNNTPFEAMDLEHLWVDVTRDLTTALLKEIK